MRKYLLIILFYPSIIFASDVFHASGKINDFDKLYGIDEYLRLNLESKAQVKNSFINIKFGWGYVNVEYANDFTCYRIDYELRHYYSEIKSFKFEIYFQDNIKNMITKFEKNFNDIKPETDTTISFSYGNNCLDIEAEAASKVDAYLMKLYLVEKDDKNT